MFSDAKNKNKLSSNVVPALNRVIWNNNVKLLGNVKTMALSQYTYCAVYFKPKTTSRTQQNLP